MLALVLLGAFAFASAERCGDWPDGAPQLTFTSRAEGALEVGVAKIAVKLDAPVTIGGYGPLRSSAAAGEQVMARTTLVSVGGTRFALVSLDLLLLPQPLVTAIREGYDFPIIVTATHTHSSIGQFDRRLAAQVAALGSFDDTVEQALVTAARTAIDTARAHRVAATMELRTFSTAAFTRARSGSAVDERGTEVRFVQGDGAVVGRWLLLAAHPTLAPRRGGVVDTDWPGAVAADGAGVTLVLQTSVGNASIAKDRFGSKELVAKALADALDGGSVELAPTEPQLAIASARVELPHPDGSRLAPWPFTRIAENALCARQEMDVEVAMLRFGPLSLLALPVEPSFESAQVLERMSGATRVLALANGYVGYLEPAEVVKAGGGEAKRQWFGPELFERLGKASLLVAMATDRGGPRVQGK